MQRPYIIDASKRQKLSLRFPLAPYSVEGVRKPWRSICSGSKDVICRVSLSHMEGFKQFSCSKMDKRCKPASCHEDFSFYKQAAAIVGLYKGKMMAYRKKELFTQSQCSLSQSSRPGQQQQRAHQEVESIEVSKSHTLGQFNGQWFKDLR